MAASRRPRSGGANSSSEPSEPTVLDFRDEVDASAEYAPTHDDERPPICEAVKKAPCGELCNVCLCAACVLITWTIAYFLPELGDKYSSYLVIAARERPERPYETSAGWGRARNDTDRACARRCLKDGVGSVFFMPLDRWGGGMVASKGGYLRSTVGELEPASPSVARMVDLFQGRVCFDYAGVYGGAVPNAPLDFGEGRSQAELLETGRAALMAPANWQAHAHAGRPNGAAPNLYVGQVSQPFDPRLLRHEGLVTVAELRHPLASASPAIRKARGGGGGGGGGKKGTDEYDTFPWEGRKVDKYGDNAAGAAAKAVLKATGSTGVMSKSVRSGRWHGGGGSGGSMMDRAQGGRRGVQLDSDNFVVRMLANLPTMMKSDVTIAVFRRAKRVLQSFDLILVGEWERDPRQRRALVDLLLRNAVSSWGGSGHARAKSGTSAYGTRTGEEYAEQQLSRYMDDDTVAALLGLGDVAAEAAAGAMAAGPSWFVDGELSEEDNKGRTGWIASHSDFDLRLFSQAVNFSAAATLPANKDFRVAPSSLPGWETGCVRAGCRTQLCGLEI